MAGCTWPGGCVPAQRGVYLPWGVPTQGDVHSGRVYLPGGDVPAMGGVPARRRCTCQWGVPAQGVYLSGGRGATVRRDLCASAC